MPARKKIKISLAKRGHHEKHKKNFAKTAKHIHREKQIAANLLSKKKSGIRVKTPSDKLAPSSTKRKKVQRVENIQYTNVDDVKDMMDDGYYDQPKNNGERLADEESIENLTQMMEDEYQKQVNDRNSATNERRALLPIKTKRGHLINRSAELSKQQLQSSADQLETEIDGLEQTEQKVESEVSANKDSIINTTHIISERQQEIERQKFIIGVTCASILENPELKIKGLNVLIELIPETSQAGKVNMFIIRKLAMVSIVEIFKDLIPEYRLGIIDTSTQKLRKNTLARVSYENELLLHYKKFLVLCEGFAQEMLRRKHTNCTAETQEISATAVQSMCDLLIGHPYFNYNMNVAQMLVSMLNCDLENVRKTVHSCFAEIFKTDNRYDLSKHIVRHINQLVKKKQHHVHPEMVSCLKYLQIKDVNVEAEVKKEMKLKKLEAHKSRVINLSRQERKRKKKLAELERELFETKAEESKQIKQTKLTDLTKLVFTIFFRILKTAPKSKLLSVTLEGLSKFAHAINVEFFSDLIEVMNSLLSMENLGYREQLHCIQTVFTILRGQGELLNIDPARFYTHLYKNLLRVHAGKNESDFESVLITLDNVLLKRRNNITYHRYLAFIKRIAMMALQLSHFGALGCLAVIKSGMILNSSLDILLDTDRTLGSGKYNSEVEEPEFCNANCTLLYELATLARNYHPTVRRLARNVLAGVPNSGPGMLPPDLAKLSPHEFYTQYDSSKMAFKPPVMAPKQKNSAPEALRKHVFADIGLEEYCNKASAISYNPSGFDFWQNARFNL